MARIKVRKKMPEFSMVLSKPSLYHQQTITIDKTYSKPPPPLKRHFAGKTRISWFLSISFLQLFWKKFFGGKMTLFLTVRIFLMPLGSNQ